MEVLPSVPPSGVSVYLYAADSLIIPPSSDPLYRHGRTVLPIKTFTYLASGRPILAPDRPDIRETLIDGHNAVLVPPDHPQQASILLRRLLGDRGLQERLSGNAKDDARKYTWDGRADRILEFLRRIL
jgi:glycosyltransferase involved in cell wall biosynthesis